MNFRSDNTAACAPEIMAALNAVNEQPAAAYGDDRWSRQLNEKFGELFEREARVFTVATGTAANSIALASATPPWGAILCHEEAHIARDECGAPEFYSGGAKLLLIEGSTAKITPASLGESIARNTRDIHSVKPLRSRFRKPRSAAMSIAPMRSRGSARLSKERTWPFTWTARASPMPSWRWAARQPT